MDSSSSVYAHLLERTRVPQPELQRYAVAAIFHKLKSSYSSSTLVGINSNSGREALSQCLRSPSPAAADQAVRELCRFAKDGLVTPQDALVELQAGLEGCAPQIFGVFVKAIGFVCRFAFKNDRNWGRRFDPVELHPFIKVLCFRSDVQEELIQQVILFIVHNKFMGGEVVVEFLKPIFFYSIIRMPFSASLYSFVRELYASVASVCCSLSSEAMPYIKILTTCLMYFSCNSNEEVKCFIGSIQCLVDAVVVVLKQTRLAEMLVKDVQACSLELLNRLFSLHACLSRHDRGTETVINISKHLLLAQRECGCSYLPDYGLVIQYTTSIFFQTEIEHEHLTILKILIFLLEWKTEKGYDDREYFSCLGEDLLLILPVINTLSSPSKSVKAAATHLLSLVEGKVVDLLDDTGRSSKSFTTEYSSLYRLELIPNRLLNQLWYQGEQSTFTYLGYFCKVESATKGLNPEQKDRIFNLQMEYLLAVAKLKSMPPYKNQGKLSSGVYLLISSVVLTLVMHPMHSTLATEALASLGVMEPKLGVPLLLAVLFCIRVLCTYDRDVPKILLKFLEVLPQLAIHAAVAPLVVQSFSQMLHAGDKSVLYAVAVRFFCKTWLVTDRAFGSFQENLDPKSISNSMSERDISLSIAASVRDVCKHNPDRGVDLILSVASLIESKDSALQALGFESLAHLCEADLVDFYTAWDVIRKHMQDYSLDPVVAYSLCILLQWGALDAEAYAMASIQIIKILWEVGTLTGSRSGRFWTRARACAFKSLSKYEVEHLLEVIPDFKEQNVRVLVSEDNVQVLKSMEELQIKILNYEHVNRRRVTKPKKSMVHKVDKLLEVFPQVMFPKGKQKISASNLPGASLFSLFLTPKDFQSHRIDKGLLHSAYEDLLVEVAMSLHISRNIVVAFLVLQSWKAFSQRWLKAATAFSEARVSSQVIDGSSEAADRIFKIMCKVAVDTIPRVAANIALAIGAFCSVLPTMAYATIASASKFLLNWLSEYEYEYRQWSAALSLGMITNCLQATDRAQKLEILSGLLKVFNNSKSHLVKGACGVGLGFASQSLFTGSNADESEAEGRSREASLFRESIKSMCLFICEVCPGAFDYLKNLNDSFGLNLDHKSEEHADSEYLTEDMWGVAGVVLGLGYSVFALYRMGSSDAVVNIKDILVSWVPNVHASGASFSAYSKPVELQLSIGSCLALPTVLAFCQRNELMGSNLDFLFNRYCMLIAELLKYKNFGIHHQNLLMTSCIGAGSLLSVIVNDGGQSLKFDDVKQLLEILRECYTQPYNPGISFGGMIGVVNAFGADAGNLTHSYPPYTLQMIPHEQDIIRGPILCSSICEPLSTSVIQEIYLLAKESKDQQLRDYASWALSFLRHRWLSKEYHDSNFLHSNLSNNPSNHDVSEDSLVWKLSSWLKDINSNKPGVIPHSTTAATVLRCLSKAPRLPALDWGAIIRRCMRCKVYSSDTFQLDQTYESLRKECILFSIAHASAMSSLMLFLDEVTDLPRFRTLELSIQCLLVENLSNLWKIFSASRLEILLNDLLEYLTSSFSSCMIYHQRILFRTSFWKGLYLCLGEAEKPDIMTKIEKCMRHLFTLLPLLTFSRTSTMELASIDEEWSAAVACLCKGQQNWVMNMLEVSGGHLLPGGEHTTQLANRMSATARLAKIGFIPFHELAKLKNYILHPYFEDPVTCWTVLVEVVTGLSAAEFSIKRQWLIDALEISCISDYPLLVLQFIGLLSGSCCELMPLLMMDPASVLIDLPVTLPSLLSDSGWKSSADYLISLLLTCTEHIFSLRGAYRSESASPREDEIKPGDGINFENKWNLSQPKVLPALACIMHQTCVALKGYLSFEKQLKLAMLPA